MWVALAAALAVHAAIFGSVDALGLTMLREGLGHGKRARPTAAEDVELAANCAGDAVLATSGRGALCFAPWVQSPDACLRDVEMSLWLDLSSCQAGARRRPRSR